MGSRTRSGVSPGQSRAMTGAATGPGSISGLSVKDAQKVVDRAARLGGDFLTPEKVDIAAQSFGINRNKPFFPGQSNVLFHLKFFYEFRFVFLFLI